MKRWQIEDRDRKWYKMSKEGMSQREIAEKEDTTQSYVSDRIRKHKAKYAISGRHQSNAQIALVRSTLIKEEYTAQCNNFNSIREDNFEDPQSMLIAILSVAPGMGYGLIAKMGNMERNPHGDFIQDALDRYAAFAEKFDDFGGRISD